MADKITDEDLAPFLFFSLSTLRQIAIGQLVFTENGQSLFMPDSIAVDCTKRHMIYEEENSVLIYVTNSSGVKRGRILEWKPILAHVKILNR